MLNNEMNIASLMAAAGMVSPGMAQAGPSDETGALAGRGATPFSEFLFYDEGSLCLAEKSKRLTETTKTISHPAYVYNLALALSRLNEMQTALPGASLHYAMKANSHPEILKAFRRAGARIDVVSGGELKRALSCGFEPKDVLFSGVGKTEDEIKLALSREGVQLNIESLPEMARVARLARETGTTALVGLRMNPDVDIKTHPYLATGLAENKFGMDFGQLPALEKVIRESAGHVKLLGLSLHLGSQMMELSGLRAALRALKNLYVDVRTRHATLDSFDAGGGLGIYYDKDAPAEESALLLEYASIILILHGEFDPVLPVTGSVETAKLLPHGEFRLLTGRGHSANIEDPNSFVDIVQRFL